MQFPMSWWYGSDNALLIKSSFFRPVLPDSDMQATVSPVAVFMPQSGSDLDSGCPDPDFDCPSPVPSYKSRPSRPSSPFPSPPPIASSSRLWQPCLNPIGGTATHDYSFLEAPGDRKGKRKRRHSRHLPKNLTAKLGANTVHRNKVISKS